MERATRMRTGRRGAAWMLRPVLLVAGAVLLQACATGPLANQRVAAYAPRIGADERPVMRTDAGQEPGGRDVTNRLPPDDGGAMAGYGRFLRRGERVAISLLGIPQPQTVEDVIDDEGNVNLPFIGSTRLIGLTTSDAEKAIEKEYIDRGYYKKINVIVVAQEDSYFVRGEVNRPGKYVLSGDTTILMAIGAAAGYTDFANPRKIRIVRGEKNITVNANRIEAREDEDVLLESNDLIIVPRRWVF